MDILTISDLSKTFGDQHVLDQLSLSVPKGSIFGFIGKNGSGKTTTMKIALGLLKADSGNIEVCGEKVRYGDSKTNRFIGYLPDVPEFYPFMTAREYLELCGEITHVPNSLMKKKSDELLTLVGLADTNKRIGTYSRGMKQRLGIAQALLNEPELLICDEPTSALDPIGRREILDILLKVKDKTTVIFSTHVLSDVEAICDKIGILDQGKIVLTGGMEEIKRSYQQHTCIVGLANPADTMTFLASEKLKRLTGNSLVQGNTISIATADPKGTMALIMASLISLQIVPVKLEISEPKLEDIFREAVK